MKVFDRSVLYSYTLCTWVSLLKILKHTFYLLPEWPYWKTSQWKIWNLAIFIKALIKSGSCSLVLKISFIPKISFFTLSQNYFPICYILAWFNVVIFYSLVFVYTHLWILVYLQFTIASFSFDSQWQQINLEKVYRPFTSNSFCHQETKKQTVYAWNFLQSPMQDLTSKIHLIFLESP